MVPVELPEGLAALPPGPGLGAALAALDPRRVANVDTVTVLAARYRQLAHEQARLLEALVEVGRSDPDDLTGAGRLDEVGEWAAGEIAAALALTGVAADRELAFADAVVTRLPSVWAALNAGELDRAKAWLLADHLADLSTEQIDAICAVLLPAARRLTTGQLRARLARMLHDIDPDHARRRYQRAVRERAVIGYLAPDGTVTITANGLPADEAATTCERLDVLAHAVQRAGHPGRLGQIQTDLFLGMLDGTFHHLTETEIIAALLGRPRPEDAEPGDPPAPSAPAPEAAPEARTDTRALVTAQHRGAEWRFAITDADGQLLLAGVTRRRPIIPAPDQGRRRGGLVELHIDADTLRRLAADSTRSPWAGVVADLADQYTHRARRITRVDQRIGDRFARAALARHIEIRDRTCAFPGCRRPARRSDKDHTHDHAGGGTTTSENIGPLCGRHHRYKSLGWWTLTQPEPGRFRWTSPLTRCYRTRGEPIRPPTVPPRPRAHPSRDTGSARHLAGPILRQRREPPRRPEVSRVNEEPPF